MNCANHLDREQTAFCQNCGKPLCPECTRRIGDAVYCEPCLAAKLAGTQTAPPPAYTYPGPAAAAYAAGIVPPPPGAPRPVLAGILGFIPGVGAMYNEQYVKAGVHLIVFVILVSLADSNGVFGILIAGWQFYMAFEAYHTARCRRDGLPLPNPFGLNDLGHKLGLDKTSFNGGAPPAAPAAPPDPYAAAYGQPAYGTVPPAADVPAAYPSPYPASSSAVPPTWAATPSWEQYTQPGWQGNPVATPTPPAGVPLDSQVPYPGNRFPAGAIWLIGLGAIFLLFNAGMFHGITVRLFVPTLLIGLAVFIFIRKLTDYGYGLTSDGTVEYRIRVFRALRGSVWLALVGLLFLLNEFTPLHWGRSWPLFIILAGVMTVLQRAVYSGAAAAAPPYAPGYAPGYVPPYPPGYGYPPPQQPADATPVSAEPSATVPISTHDAIVRDRISDSISDSISDKERS